jgi:hypothetical protein
MEGIIIADYDDKKFCKLVVIKTDGSREIYESSVAGFVKTMDLPAPAAADHAHSTEGHTGEIKHGNDVMTFENGLLVKYG